MRQFGLWNCRARAADRRWKGREARVAAAGRLQHVRRAVLEVTGHDRIGPRIPQDFGRVAQFRRAVRQHGSRSTLPRRQRTVRSRVLKVGAVVKTSARKVWFHVSASWPGRAVFGRVCAAVRSFTNRLGRLWDDRLVEGLTIALGGPVTLSK